ncbi:COP23 domain-containing protein [Dapis sp. BLCC M229]|uniref:COP23 domain-containing protein n=1 Tax=Dapis sp. BLCC M229 TaxID=3400188 RepID=UPI003CF8B9FD
MKKTDRFSCELRQDTNKGKEVWTVMYDNDKKKQPWLGMVIPMGGGWSPERRCQEIERRLENFREDGLVSLGYRDDPDTPQQQVLCVKTKSSGENCPLLMTLDVGMDGYEAFRATTKALKNEDVFYQSANSGSFGESRVVYLETFLAEEDKLTGK